MIGCQCGLMLIGCQCGLTGCDWLSGMKQMFSQGMADVLLDACSDFWDGQDIRPLGTEERHAA